MNRYEFKCKCKQRLQIQKFYGVLFCSECKALYKFDSTFTCIEKWGYTGWGFYTIDLVVNDQKKSAQGLQYISQYEVY